MSSKTIYYELTRRLTSNQSDAAMKLLNVSKFGELVVDSGVFRPLAGLRHGLANI